MIYHLDYIDLLHSIEDNSIDAAVSDVPYGIAYASWDTCINYDLLFKELYRTVTGNILLFMGWSNVISFILSAQTQGFYLIDWIIYDRIKGRGAKNKLISTREDIIHLNKSPTGYIFNKEYSNTPKKTKGMGLKNGQKNRALTNVWTDISPIVPWSKERVNHPTQKPLQLIDRLIRIYTNPGNIILDPFIGSGTTAVSALNNNRKIIGGDINKEYIELTNQRIYNR